MPVNSAPIRSNPAIASKQPKLEWQDTSHLNRMSQLAKAKNVEEISNLLQRAEQGRQRLLAHHPSPRNREKASYQSRAERGRVLIAGAKWGKANLVSAAIEPGALSQEDLASSLKISASRGFPEIAKLLVARAKFSDKEREAALEKLKTKEMPLLESEIEAAQVVLESGDIPDPVREKLIEKAAKDDSPEFISALLQTGHNPTHRHFALQKAADANAAQCIHSLIHQKKTSVESIDRVFIKTVSTFIQQPFAQVKKTTLTRLLDRISKKTVKLVHQLANKGAKAFFTPGPYKMIDLDKPTESDPASRVLAWVAEMLSRRLIPRKKKAEDSLVSNSASPMEDEKKKPQKRKPEPT